MLWAHNGLLSVFANAGLVADAEALFGAMQDRGPKPDMVAHNTVISAYAQVPGAATPLLRPPVLLGLGPHSPQSTLQAPCCCTSWFTALCV